MERRFFHGHGHTRNQNMHRNYRQVILRGNREVVHLCYKCTTSRLPECIQTQPIDFNVSIILMPNISPTFFAYPSVADITRFSRSWYISSSRLNVW